MTAYSDEDSNRFQPNAVQQFRAEGCHFFRSI